MTPPDLDQLRKELVDLNFAIMHLLNRRAAVVEQVHAVKKRDGIPTYVPEREQQMLEQLVAANNGPFPDKAVAHLFKEIFRASVALQEAADERGLQVSRACCPEDRTIRIRGRELGAEPVVIAGRCAVESEAQMELVATELAALGVGFLLGGTFKPRSSPYSFQGMGEPGLKLLNEVGQANDLVTVTEVMDTRQVELVAEYADVLQIGARNMHNTPLLREVGRCGKPVLLKRGLAATLDEFIWAAEYIVAEGNQDVILCERGIRTFERQTRNTLDISAIPLLVSKTYLPVIVDVSHAAGRKDILAPLSKAALAAGAHGLMVEVHPFPAVARSDSQQQLDLDEFRRFLAEVGLPARQADAVSGRVESTPKRNPIGATT